MTGYNWPSDDDCAVTNWTSSALSTSESLNSTRYVGTLFRSDGGIENFDFDGTNRGTTDIDNNLPPIAGRNSPYTVQICQSAVATFFWGFDGLPMIRMVI